MELESTKIIGGIGALLLVIGSVTGFFTPFVEILSLIGIILVLVAMHSLANIYHEQGIFRNATYFVVAAIIGIVAAIATVVASIIYFVSNIPIWAQPYIPSGSNIFNSTSWANSTNWTGLAQAIQQNSSDLGSIWVLIGAVILALVILWVLLIVAMVFFRRSLGTISTKTNVGLFGTTGLLMLIGACLTVIFIGLILIWIGWILLTVSFFSIKSVTPPQSAPPSPPMQPQ